MNDPVAILERSLRRDAALRAAGHEPGPVTESHIVDFIVKHRLYDSETARRWLVERSSTRNYWVGRGIVEAIGRLSECGYARDAVAMFSSVIGLGDENVGPERRKQVLHMQSSLRHELEKLLETPGLMSSHPNAWGKCLVHLQSVLLFEEQREEFERWEKRSGAPNTRQPDYDYRFHYWFYQTERPERETWAIVAKAVERGLTEAVALSEKRPFCILADELLASEWGLAICQPLVALYDHTRTHVERSWQHDEAIRLLRSAEIEKHYAAFAWRRLLRKQLLPVATNEERNALATTIRESQHRERVRVSELADFEESGVLTQDEESAIDKARRDGELFGPTDPRELRSLTQGASFSSETPTDRFIKAWPHSEDHASLRLLAGAERIGGEAAIVDVEASLFPRLDALNAILDRPESDSPDWLGEILGWCERAIGDMKQWYRIKREVPKDAEIGVDQYLETLEEKTPWWENRVGAALERLKQPPPEDHASYQWDHISWGSNDLIACSLNYLDEVLAAPTGSKLDAYRSNLAETIVEAWDAWPTYTRGLTIAILRTYYWSKCDNLADLLVRILKTETHSRDIEFSLHHLLRLGQSGITELMRSLINRIDTLTNPSEIAHLIGGVIGNAVARCRGDGDDAKELADISRLYDDLSADRSQGQSVRYSLVASIVEGAKSHLGSLDRLERTHAEVWLSVVTWGLNDWLEMGDDQRNDLPVLPVSAVREMRWDNDQQIFLLEGIADILMRIINEAGLGAFYEMHYELRKLLKDGESEQSVVLDRAVRLSLDQILIAFCRASAERVAQWRKKGRTTNDLAYIFSLNGDNTSELITLVFESAMDRENARRELAPIIDILADAGLHDTSSRLRSKLRHS